MPDLIVIVYTIVLTLCGQFYSQEDDIKMIQESMGHHSAAIILDRYGHITNTIRREL